MITETEIYIEAIVQDRLGWEEGINFIHVSPENIYITYTA